MFTPAAAFLLVVAAANSSSSSAGDDAHLIGELIAASAAKVPNVDVLTGEDVRKAASVEADKAMLGCSEQSCLAEIANAMGAAVVLYGNIGHLAADDMVLTLSLFDSEAAASGGREVIRGPTLKALADQVDPKVQALVTSGLGKRAALGKRVRLLVLDLDVRGSSTSPDGPGSAASTGPPWLTIGGGVVLALGAVGLVFGALADADAVQSNTNAADNAITQKQAAQLYDKRDNDGLVALLGYGAGGALAVAGVAMVIVGVTE